MQGTRGNSFMRNYAVHNPEKMWIVSFWHIFHSFSLLEIFQGVQINPNILKWKAKSDNRDNY